ncbi:CTP:molybdopterin cytidylyltransferase MocA [Agromyces sp. 3263]|uniref:molybdenum cofactor guanylyltransferase n=1 Tax=Agromyces sp. 3263 TaxID=2817750 RepID=UPI00285DF00B|nr:NTP transferase domain-containing protein [Agromyces sp. 3263]MDR6906231.1 CTP:molybdopterin cytidylyltransferase MocA [Agromyces sp. 3263]
MLVVDAVILMGGRATRLDGVAKGDLRVGGRTLLERVVDAASVARNRVVVGEPGVSVLPTGVRVVREEPRFGGPAAAVAAGVAALPTDAGAVLLLAGDQPFVAEAVPILLAALDADRARDQLHDGVRAVDAAGRAQHLTSVIRRSALVAAITATGAAGASLDGVAMRRLLEPLRLLDVQVPEAATMDVDTWADAKAVGATGGEGS